MNRKEKTVFLTALSDTRHRLDVDFYVCDGDSGNRMYTTGISAAEAGIKYALSTKHIDEIIVAADASCIRDDEPRISAAADLPLQNMGALEDMSEYGFLCYRLTEYMHQMDFEMLDIQETVREDRAAELQKEIESFRSAHMKMDSVKNLFARLCEDEILAKAFDREILAHCSDEEQKWVRHYLFARMDSFLKMHMLSENRNAVIRFVPIERDRYITIESITHLVDETLGDDGFSVNLYLDMQGLGAIEGNTLISTFILLNRKTGYHCEVCGLISGNRVPEAFAGKVENVLKNYEIQQLITGIDIFLEYGKDGKLKEYWQKQGIEDPDVDRLFTGMDCVDEGITLCNVDLMAGGIEVIRSVIRNPETPPENQSIYTRILFNAIRYDYGPLLKEEELSVPRLLEWSLKKGLYQQVLTVIESKVPQDMVRRGIYYYAETEEDLRKLMDAFNVLYWNEQAKMRWSFDDVDHYFIKFYGRFGIDFRQKPDKVAMDFARLKIDALHGTADVICPAFSQLKNDDMLYELLLGYYRIGNLRNVINHAGAGDLKPSAGVPVRHKDSREDLHLHLQRFIDLYAAVCRRTVKTKEPLILTSGRMKGYIRRHELVPLESSAEQKLESSYMCQFNGKEVLVRIAMLKPDEYSEPDE